MKSVALRDFPQLQRGQPLARYTAARLGGRADFLYHAKDPDYADVSDLLRLAWARDLPVTVIGGGANVLVADAGVRGLVIVNRATRLSRRGNLVTAAAGTSLIRLSRYCLEQGLGGMEWAIAVPGTVGGAVVNNAGAHGGDIASSLIRAQILQPGGEARWIETAELDYDYRHSSLKIRSERRFFVLQAQFALEEAERESIQARMAQYNDYRRRTQPPGASLGSIYKNPPGDYAGRLIEAAGLKGERIGAVQVSPLHANFFISLDDSATARDYWRLIQRVRARTHAQTGVTLELEIQLLGDWS